jgi:LicD family
MVESKMLDETIFFEVVEILNQAKIDWWIDHGTLLGYVRDGKPIEWDQDFDVGTSASIEYIIENILPMVQKKFPQAYIDSMANALKIQCFNKTTGSWTIDIASYRFESGRAIKNWPNLTKSGNAKKILVLLISAMCGRIATRNDKLITRIISLMLRPVVIITTALVTPKIRHQILSKISRKLPYAENSVKSDFFEKLDILKINENKLVIPTKCNEYLVVRYGKDWKIPQKKWNYITDDGGLV